MPLPRAARAPAFKPNVTALAPPPHPCAASTVATLADTVFVAVPLHHPPGAPLRLQSRPVGGLPHAAPLRRLIRTAYAVTAHCALGRVRRPRLAGRRYFSPRAFRVSPRDSSSPHPHRTTSPNNVTALALLPQSCAARGVATHADIPRALHGGRPPPRHAAAPFGPRLRSCPPTPTPCPRVADKLRCPGFGHHARHQRPCPAGRPLPVWLRPVAPSSSVHVVPPAQDVPADAGPPHPGPPGRRPHLRVVLPCIAPCSLPMRPRAVPSSPTSLPWSRPPPAGRRYRLRWVSCVALAPHGHCNATLRLGRPKRPGRSG